MIDDGLFKKFPMDAVYALHNMPMFPLGKFAVRTGAYMAGVDSFVIEIRGKGSHAAMPHKGVDPIVVGSSIVTALQTVVSRSVDPMQTAVVSVTQFHGGDTFNAIPDTTTLSGDVRSYSKEVQNQIRRRIELLSKNIAASYGAEIEFTYDYGQAPVINTTRETEYAIDAACLVKGEENIGPIMASDDFSAMLDVKPGCYMMIGNGNQEEACMVHSPTYDFNDEAIPDGAAYWIKLVEGVLSVSQ